MLVLIIFPLASALSACGQTTESFAAQRKTRAADEIAQSERTAQLVKRLEIARELDQSDANDPDLTPIRREHFTVKAAKADRAIRELRNGFALSSDEIEEVLEIPPRHVTTEKRVQSVHQLLQPTALNEQRAQEILIYSRDDAAGERAALDRRAERAARIANDPQRGESVEGNNFKPTLFVPGDPL
jgi:hypothetical protein